MGKTQSKAYNARKEKKEEVKEENYPGKLIIEWSERRHSPFGEYSVRWDKGFYMEKTYCEVRDEFYVLYHMGKDFAIVRKEDKETAERKKNIQRVN